MCVTLSRLRLYLIASVFFFLFLCIQSKNEVGYITYCPCMGRFGNQADHFLGSLAFSKSINRSLILPPWVEYKYGETKSIQVPFTTYFKIDELKDFHHVITMEEFMEKLASKIWPPSKRIAFCYMKRSGTKENSCNAKDGNPFGSFWNTYGIEFIDSEFYAPLNYDVQNAGMMEKWKTKYPSNDWPVLTFTGAPASFPVQSDNRILQKYLVWSDDISMKSNSYIKSNMTSGGFIGIHLRNGPDWLKVCQHVNDSPLLFSAPQCVGYKNERGPLTASMCLPSKGDIIKQLKRALKKLNHIKYIFVASDSNHMIEEISESLRRIEVSVLRLKQNNPHLDLAILAQANYFIGNCVSSYSAFVKRERDVKGLPSEFWSYPSRRKQKHEEL